MDTSNLRKESCSCSLTAAFRPSGRKGFWRGFAGAVWLLIPGLLSCQNDDRVLTAGKPDTEADEAAESVSSAKVDFSITGEDEQGNSYAVDQLHVVVRDSDANVIFEETLDVSGPGGALGAALGLPPGQGYTIQATGDGTATIDLNNDGVGEVVMVSCTGEATFDVAAGQENPPVALNMVCTAPVNPGSGQLGVDADFSFQRHGACGLLTVEAGPLTILVDGGEMKIDASSSVETSASWSVDPQIGTFADASAHSTTFDCDSEGQATVRVDIQSSTGSCQDFAEIEIACVGALPECGNNVAEPGEPCDGTDTPVGEECSTHCSLVVCGDNTQEGSEACDDGNTQSEDGCNADCSAAEDCGDGVVQSGLGEDCEPPSQAGCGADCRWLVDGGADAGSGSCGNGVTEPGEDCDGLDTPEGLECTSRCSFVRCGDFLVEGIEECDDGNTEHDDGCSPDCFIEVCGDGVVQPSLGEECDPPGSNTTTGACDDYCHMPAAPDCGTCTAQQCSTELAQCDSFSALCHDVLDCYAQSGCAKGEDPDHDDLVPCLCGKSDTGDYTNCLLGITDNPACLTPALTAADVQTAGQALLAYDVTDPVNALSASTFLAHCQYEKCSESCTDIY